jgi:hypothetical protein
MMKGGLCEPPFLVPIRNGSAPACGACNKPSRYTRFKGSKDRYLTTPSRGELAVAYNFFAMRPERYAWRPAMTA